jgi:hypothetical protein
MVARQVTAADLVAITGYSRDQLRGLLAELPLFAQRKGEARVANIYSRQDVLVVAICCRLETQYGLKRAAVAALSEVIARCLVAPRQLGNGARLVLKLQPPAAQFVERVDDLADGLVVALDSIFDTINACQAASFVASSRAQRDLEFPLHALPPDTSPRRVKAMTSLSANRRSTR